MKKTKGIKKFISVGVLLVTCLLIVSGLLFVRNHKKSKAYEQAMSFFEQNKYGEAAEVFSSIGHYKDAQKLEDRCRLELGNYYLKNNEYDKAENEFKQINDISLYEEACRLWEEQAKKQNYEDNIVIDKTVAKAKDILSNGYSGTERLYHATTVNSSSVNYDWSTRTYTCYVNITYSTNVFDFWGTSSNTYDITATYVDGGGELIATGFDIF